MTILIEGSVATLYDNNGQAILRIGTFRNELTAEILDHQQIIEERADPLAQAIDTLCRQARWRK